MRAQSSNMLPASGVVPEKDDRMLLVIELARRNFQEGTGGPFAAGVFETLTGRIVSLGVNRVVPCNNSSAHAEIVAISLAQAELKGFDLGSADVPSHQLVVNGRPCAMCFGAIPWSGIRSLVVAADGPDIERITGFDEGPVHPQWVSELEKRGIEVEQGVLADKAIEVFQDFASSDSPVYNGRGD